jgi:hypothetical protein
MGSVKLSRGTKRAIVKIKPWTVDFVDMDRVNSAEVLF